MLWLAFNLAETLQNKALSGEFDPLDCCWISSLMKLGKIHQTATSIGVIIAVIASIIINGDF